MQNRVSRVLIPAGAAMSVALLIACGTTEQTSTGSLSTASSASAATTATSPGTVPTPAPEADRCSFLPATTLEKIFKGPAPAGRFEKPSAVASECVWGEKGGPRVRMSIETTFLYTMAEKDPMITPYEGLGKPALVNPQRNGPGRSVVVKIDGGSLDVGIYDTAIDDETLLLLMNDALAALDQIPKKGSK